MCTGGFGHIGTQYTSGIGILTSARWVKSTLIVPELLHEVLLDLLQPGQPVLDLQVNLSPLEMVPNDSS